VHHALLAAEATVAQKVGKGAAGLGFRVKP